jgi:phosphohistidine phosphatase
MKKLILVRHGKAEDETSDFADFERSLTSKGKLVAIQMARRLLEKEESLGVLISSPAFRALETALIFAREFRISADSIILNSNIYFKMSYRNLPDILSTIDEANDTVTMFGHNPSFTEIADILSKEGCDSIPKTGIICISFKIMTWSELGRNSGKTEYFLKPE